MKVPAKPCNCGKARKLEDQLADIAMVADASAHLAAARNWQRLADALATVRIDPRPPFERGRA